MSALTSKDYTVQFYFLLLNDHQTMSRIYWAMKFVILLSSAVLMVKQYSYRQKLNQSSPSNVGAPLTKSAHCFSVRTFPVCLLFLYEHYSSMPTVSLNLMFLRAYCIIFLNFFFKLNTADTNFAYEGIPILQSKKKNVEIQVV